MPTKTFTPALGVMARGSWVEVVVAHLEREFTEVLLAQPEPVTERSPVALACTHWVAPLPPPKASTKSLEVEAVLPTESEVVVARTPMRSLKEVTPRCVVEPKSAKAAERLVEDAVVVKNAVEVPLRKVRLPLIVVEPELETAKRVVEAELTMRKVVEAEEVLAPHSAKMF
jgi:hypothetical protein